MKHTLSSCKLSASSFSTRSEWKRSDNTSYQAALRNGWLNECCGHMVTGKAGPKFGQRNYTTEQWVRLAVAKHAGKYDYSQVAYSDSKAKVTIVCPDHGPFEQAPFSHLLGTECPVCGIKKQTAARTPAADIFIGKARLIHGARYDYSKVKYAGRKRQVEIVCARHGSFFQTPGDHIDKAAGCSKCTCSGPSSAETEVFDFIRTMCCDAQQSVVGLLSDKRELDMVIPSKRIAVEFNGLIWHSAKFGKGRGYHQKKSDDSLSAGYRLIHIWEDEWREKRDWCEAFIRMQLVGPDRKFYARNCSVRQISPADANLFHDTFHLQGGKGGRSLGVYSADSELLAVATLRGGELARWTVKFGVVVVGALSRVMRAFGENVISYCDTAKHDGRGYIAAGFELVSHGEPSYHYTDGKVRINRVRFQKHKLLGIEGAVGSTEKELAASLGFYQIGGCRQLRFEYKHLPGV